MMWDDGGWANDGWGIAGWVVMALLMVVFWAAVVTIVVWVLRGHRPSMSPSTTSLPDGDSARRILDERFARGEIDEDEYRQRRAALSER